MSSLSQSISQSQSSAVAKAPKSKQQYSRNVKKLKIKLKRVQEEIEGYEKKIKTYQNTSNDKIVAMKISKHCRERRLTPEMLFRFADKNNKQKITKQQFKRVLENLGIKLTQHESTRLQYLLDEDLSGQISKLQYYSYLHAYGIKGEYSADDPFLKDALKKFDIDKIKLISDEKRRDTEDSVGKKHRQLLNYEQFLKYCHRHLPQLSDKQIASIFNRLQKNGFIDLDEFIAYLKKREEEERKLREKNRGKGKDKGKDKGKQEDETKTLKGRIKALIKNRPKDYKSLFHSSQFQRLQRILEEKKGELMRLFKQIDKKNVGSFGFNQIIHHYIQRQSKEKEGLLFTYELMGRKLTINKEKPEDIINQYNKGDKNISTTEFINFASKEFQIKDGDAKKLFKCLHDKDNQIPVRLIIDAMKLQQGQKRIIYIKPSLWGSEGKDFFKKNSLTLLANPLVALRFCISIMTELQKQKLQFWDDFEFGPTFQDPFGNYSISMDIPTEDVKWLTVNSLGMNDFYPYVDIRAKGKNYISSALCPHEMFLKSLTLLVEESESYLCSKAKIDSSIRDVEEKDLIPLFEGVYPLAFRSFAKYGIYVFKFFINQKWVYVITDAKIPCNDDSQPLFSMSADKQSAWISLIEKAYAKVKGNYRNMYNGETNQYIYELCRKIPLQKSFNYEFKTEEIKDRLWKGINKIKQVKKEQMFSSTVDTNRLMNNNVETGIIKNLPYKIQQIMEIQDKQTNNYHKSHRLLLIRASNIKNEQKWNFNWNQGERKNKYDDFEVQILSLLKKNKSQLDLIKESSNIIILNYKLFRNVFDRIFYLQVPSFEEMIILRKVIEFEEKFTCKYEMNSPEEIGIAITLNQLKSPQRTIINIRMKGEREIEDENKKKQKKQIVFFESKLSDNFGAVEFNLQKQMSTLEIWVQNWHKDQDHAYSLTFYMENPRFHLRQLDRHLLFHQVSPYEEQRKLSIKECEQKEKSFIYANFYKGAERTRGCC